MRERMRDAERCPRGWWFAAALAGPAAVLAPFLLALWPG